MYYLSCMPVTYYSQANVWMNEVIIIRRRLLIQLNNSRSVMLVMDNAGCHLKR